MTKQLEPLFLTWEQLVKSVDKPLSLLSPHRQAQKLKDLHDIWMIGSPSPNSGPGHPIRRLVFPHRFKEWWEMLAKEVNMGDDVSFNGTEFKSERG